MYYSISIYSVRSPQTHTHIYSIYIVNFKIDRNPSNISSYFLARWRSTKPPIYAP